MTFHKSLISLLKVFSPWTLIFKSEEMAFRVIGMLIGVFICSASVKGSSQPQARVYLTFDGKKFDKTSEKCF